MIIFYAGDVEYKIGAPSDYQSTQDYVNRCDYLTTVFRPEKINRIKATGVHLERINENFVHIPKLLVASRLFVWTGDIAEMLTQNIVASLKDGYTLVLDHPDDLT